MSSGMKQRPIAGPHAAPEKRSFLRWFHEWVGTVGGIISILTFLGIVGGGITYVFIVVVLPGTQPQVVTPAPAAGARYAAVFERAPGPGWLAFHAMTPEQYRQKSGELAPEGFRLIHLSGYSVEGEERLAAMYEQQDGPPRRAVSGLSPAQFQQRFDDLVAQGFRLVDLNGYAVGGEERLAAIFEQQAGPPFRAVSGLSPAQYQQRFDELTGLDYRLVQISGYSIDGQERLTALFEQRDGPPWLAFHGLTATQYQQTFDDLVGKGFRLVQVSGCSWAGEERFAVIFEQQDGPPLRAVYGLPSEEFQQTFDELTGQGFRLVQISGYSVD